MCRRLDVSRSGYDAWLSREPSARVLRDGELVALIRDIHLEVHGTYGSPRIHAELRRRGVRVGRKRVARLMQGAGLSGVTRRAFKTPTTQRNPRRRPAADLVNRCFEATARTSCGSPTSQSS